VLVAHVVNTENAIFTSKGTAKIDVLSGPPSQPPVTAPERPPVIRTVPREPARHHIDSHREEVHERERPTRPYRRLGAYANQSGVSGGEDHTGYQRPTLGSGQYRSGFRRH
jgi:hypothetical protein